MNELEIAAQALENAADSLQRHEDNSDADEKSEGIVWCIDYLRGIAHIRRTQSREVPGEVELQEMPEYPHESGDVRVLGPQCFVDADRKVINYRGENYYSYGQQPDCPHKDQQHRVWYWIDDPNDPAPAPYSATLDNHTDAMSFATKGIRGGNPALAWVKTFRADNEQYTCFRWQRP